VEAPASRRLDTALHESRQIRTARRVEGLLDVASRNAGIDPFQFGREAVRTDEHDPQAPADPG
jgi:hypothetical protein